ncbi:ribonuclease H-like protein [Xylaria digitata]|nr:ribonuclease H-like protein [Xylaria digitata]
MPDPYNSKGHEQAEEYTNFVGGTCNKFPSREYMTEKAPCGTDNLEIQASTAACWVCGRHSLHTDSLVIAVDGACPGNGTHHATKSGCGVFFDPNLPENLAFRVPDTPGYSHTNQRAELSAAIAAVKASKEFIYHGGQWDFKDCPTPCAVTHLVIKSDSAYLVNGMTARLEKWVQNGWRTAKGTEVKNRDLWTQLVDLVFALYRDKGAAVDFWHVPRDQNLDADYLANLGVEY